MTDVVSATEVTRCYGEGDAAVQALQGVSLGIPKGQFAAVMGPSGSGKSTLMHIMAGLDQPTTGQISIDGIELTELNDKKLTLLRREHIGFFFQFFNLLPMLTAEENVRLPLQIAGRKVDDDWVDRVIDGVVARTADTVGVMRCVVRPLPEPGKRWETASRSSPMLSRIEPTPLGELRGLCRSTSPRAVPMGRGVLCMRRLRS